MTASSLTDKIPFVEAIVAYHFGAFFYGLWIILALLHKIKEPPFGRFFYFVFPGRIRTGAVSENMPVACFPRDPASAAAEVESFLRCQRKQSIRQDGLFFFIMGAGFEASHHFNRARSDEVAEGSNPSSAAIKVAAFVYQDKGGYFVLFEQKYGIFYENRASERLRGCSEARFFHFQGKNRRIICLFFAEFKYKQKHIGGRIWTCA